MSEQPSPIEQKFREVERRLDAVLKGAEVTFAGMNVNVTDESARAYHYKNWILTWCARFSQTCEIDGEYRRVTVLITVAEPPSVADALSLRIARTAEIFSLGRPSRKRESAERNLAGTDMTSAELIALVTDELRAGKAALESG